MAIRCNEEDVRLMKRAAHGVRGIKLKTGDVVVGAGVLESDESEAQVFTISEEGYGKRNEADAYNVQKRGGIGTKNFRINDKTGEVFIGTDKGLCSYMSDATKPSDNPGGEETYAYPNPVRPNYTGLITVVGLAFNSDVKIVTTMVYL